MKRNAAWVLLIGAVALCLVGCGDDEQASNTSNTGKGGTTTSQAPGREGAVQPVPGGQGGTATAPAIPGAPGTASDGLAQQKNEYLQGVQQILTNMEQKLTAWQQQAGTQTNPEQRQKIQELSKQAQTGLTDARVAVDKMRTATATQLTDAKVAADQAMREAEAAFKNLQSYMDQTRVTQNQ